MIIKKETDKEKTVKLLQNFFYSFYKENEIAMTYVQNLEEYILKVAESATSIFAYIEDKPAGFCSFYDNLPPYAYITFYGVDPLFRGQGIAKEMILTAIKMAINSGCVTMGARVDEENIKSLKVLEDCGFVVKQKEGKVFLLEWTQEKKS